MNSEEREERLKQIRERKDALGLRHGDWPCRTVHNSRERAFQQYVLSDIDFLLSLLNSQVAVKPTGWISCGLRQGRDDRIVDIVFENADCAKAFVDSVEPTIGPIVAAAAMRDKCVGKVRHAAQMHRDWAERFKGQPMGEMQSIRAEECEGLADALQSLTLDQVEEKQ